MKKIAIGVQDFKKLRENEAFYLDKTKQLYSLLNSKVFHYFFSRPRRFGKSLMLSTIKHLFLGEKELFKNLYIAKHWDFTQTNPVLHLSFASYSDDQDLTDFIKNNGTVSYIKNGKLIEKELNEYKTFSLLYFLKEIYKETKKPTVIIVDEYDKPVLAHLQDIKKAEEVRQFFAGFYGPVKDNDKYIRLFFLTGLTKLMKMSVFSVLNNLDDITFVNDYADLIGYTQQELEDNFSEEIKEISDQNKTSYENLIEKLKVEYNGFNFSDSNLTLYNPWDINNFIVKKQLKYYWSDTGIPSAINNYIKNNEEDVKIMFDLLENKELVVTDLEMRVQDLHYVKAEVLFLNSGYLTVKEIIDDRMYMLDFPNKETEVVMMEYFLGLVTRNTINLYRWRKVANQIVNAIFTNNPSELEEGIKALIYDMLANTPYDWLNKNPEGWLKSFLGVAIRMNSIYYWSETQNILGRADFHIPKDGKIYIVEVKMNESAVKAIEQIDEKYTIQYKEMYDDVVRVGVNWNKKEKSVDVLIEN